MCFRFLLVVIIVAKTCLPLLVQNSKSLSFHYERRILSLRFSSAATRSDVPTMVREAVEEDISVDLPPLPCLDLVDEE